MPTGPVEVVSAFFACEPQREDGFEPDRLAIFDFEVGELKYGIHLALDGRMFSISADPVLPYGRESLYEIQVLFDRISIEPQECYDGAPALICRKDFEAKPNCPTIMIMKWPDGRFSVWQAYPLA